MVEPHEPRLVGGEPAEQRLDLGAVLGSGEVAVRRRRLAGLPVEPQDGDRAEQAADGDAAGDANGVDIGDEIDVVVAAVQPTLALPPPDSASPSQWAALSRAIVAVADDDTRRSTSRSTSCSRRC